MSGRDNYGTPWDESPLAEDSAFEPGAQVEGITSEGIAFTGFASETRLSRAGAEKVRVEFGPESAEVIAALGQRHGFFFASELRER